MLASRGAVYTSRKTASTTSGDRGSRPAGLSFHDRCSCHIVESHSDQDLPGIVHSLNAEWYDVTWDENGPVADQLGAWKKHVAETRPEKTTIPAPPEEAPKAGTRRPKHSGPLVLSADAGSSTAWLDRRNSLKSELHGEPLYTHEIEFLERLEGQGHLAEWLPRPAYVEGRGRLPSNDFIWLTNGNLMSELKSTTTKYSTISRHIRSAVISASEQGVVKENFVIDLGERHLGRKLRSQLERYNELRSTGTISRLWVIHGDGKVLEEIGLR